MKPVLFISHDASRTGAPMVLLSLCRWLQQHHPRGFEFVLGDGGDLESEFAALAPTTTIGRRADPPRAMAGLQAVRQRVRQGDFALVYANTVETGDILEACTTAATPVVTHVHELEFWIQHHTGRQRFGLIRDLSDRFIAVSEAVRSNLVLKHGIDPGAIDLVHAFIDTGCWNSDRQAHAAVRRALGIPESAWVVGSAGTLDWRKGPDVFVQVAGAAKRRGLPRAVHWVWIGGQADGMHVAALRHDAERMGVGATVHFAGLQQVPAPFFSQFDLFLSTSREDPFPIVNLEAAACAIPIVCFDGAGGAREFVGDDCGAVVPYLDIAGMADRVVSLLSSETQRLQSGAQAREKVRRRHDVSVAAAQLAVIIEAAIQAGPTRARVAHLARVAAQPDSERRLAAPPQASPPATALPAPSHDPAMLVLYRLASASASRGLTARARAVFETIIDATLETDHELAGKAWFKLATLDGSPEGAIHCCEHALRLLPSHRAARHLHNRLKAVETIHG